MPKPKNETIGQCRCRFAGCTESADIRRMKNHENGALYLVCPVHGVDRTSGKSQEPLDQWIDKNKITSSQVPAEKPEDSGAVTKPESVAEPAKKPEPSETDPAQDSQGSGFLKDADDAFEKWME